jgi:hypothetical protein
MEYTIITPVEMTVAAAAATTRSNSGLPWQFAVLILLALVALTVIATREYEKNQTLPAVA